MSACCHIQRVETACPQPPIQDPTGGFTTPVLVDQGLSFECFYKDCHPGVGFVRLYNSGDILLYSGCPTGRPKTYVPFNAALLDYGSYVHVDYAPSAGGLQSPCYGGHVCNRAKFRVGLGSQEIGIADLDNGNGGGGYLRYNRLSIPNHIIDAYFAGLNPGAGTGPATPSGLKATYMTQQKIVIIWNDLSAAETGYEVQRKVGTGAWATIASSLPANTTIYKDEAPPSGGAFGYGVEYSYRVRGITGSTPGNWTDEAKVTTPLAPDPSRRLVCFTEIDTCNTWTEFVPNPIAAVNYVPPGTKVVTLPAGKTLRLATINYASGGNVGSTCTFPPCPSVSAGALVEVRSQSGSTLATYPLNLNSISAAISPFPFDGRSIDSNPFIIQNSWGVSVDVFLAGGTPGSPGVYFDDSAAYQIV